MTQIAISTRLRSRNLVWMLVRCVLTVDSEMNSSVAISWLPSPRATARATSSSRSDKGCSGAMGDAAGRTNRSR